MLRVHRLLIIFLTYFSFFLGESLFWKQRVAFYNLLSLYVMLSILGLCPILLSICCWSAEDFRGSILVEGRVLQTISWLSCHLLRLWRSIWFCLSFECCWWLRRTAVCAKYRVMPSRIFRVRVKIMPCMETFFWLNAGVLEIFFYAGLLFSVFAAFVLRLSCSWSYLRRIVSFRYSVYFCR